MCTCIYCEIGKVVLSEEGNFFRARALLTAGLITPSGVARRR